MKGKCAKQRVSKKKINTGVVFVLIFAVRSRFKKIEMNL